MRPKARGLEESDPARDIHDGRFMPPALVCSCSAAILANLDAVADVLVTGTENTAMSFIKKERHGSKL